MSISQDISCINLSTNFATRCLKKIVNYYDTDECVSANKLLFDLLARNCKVEGKAECVKMPEIQEDFYLNKNNIYLNRIIFLIIFSLIYYYLFIF